MFARFEKLVQFQFFTDINDYSIEFVIIYKRVFKCDKWSTSSTRLPSAINLNYFLFRFTSLVSIHIFIYLNTLINLILDRIQIILYDRESSPIHGLINLHSPSEQREIALFWNSARVTRYLHAGSFDSF